MKAEYQISISRKRVNRTAIVFFKFISLTFFHDRSDIVNRNQNMVDSLICCIFFVGRSVNFVWVITQMKEKLRISDFLPIIIQIFIPKF